MKWRGGDEGKDEGGAGLLGPIGHHGLKLESIYPIVLPFTFGYEKLLDILTCNGSGGVGAGSGQRIGGEYGTGGYSVLLEVRMRGGDGAGVEVGRSVAVWRWGLGDGMCGMMTEWMHAVNHFVELSVTAGLEHGHVVGHARPVG